MWITFASRVAVPVHADFMSEGSCKLLCQPSTYSRSVQYRVWHVTLHVEPSVTWYTACMLPLFLLAGVLCHAGC
jgi:hypothetical protein